MNGFNRALRSHSTKEIKVEVSKSTTIRDLKVEILQETRIVPILQKLFYKDRELESDETLGGIGYLKDDEIKLVEIEEVEDADDDVNGPTGEGFRGTALLSRIACPDCTLENDGAALCCEACGRPFRV
ncbi:hypothetical protein IAR55_001943 [Kwoniella newhampshirensis]|uniref:Ubiquitin-like domain-containing protein n=1 Tax=Kwoniella newhampshirensis TaxID=1651941 RepID=A0AAW0Z3P8_9TREE